MPKDAKPLSAKKVSAIRAWIDAGADWPAEIELTDRYLADRDWWSMQPIKKASIPALTTLEKLLQAWSRTPIDHFILNKQNKFGLLPSTAASRQTLARRLYFDLLGLPPTPEEVHATGFQDPGFPGMGSWISCDLGSLNDNLPTFVVLPDHRGYASNGPKNWASAFRPAHGQGTTISPQRSNPIEDLQALAKFVTAESDRDGFTLLKKLNGDYQIARPDDSRLESRLESRIRSYELAAKI